MQRKPQTTLQLYGLGKEILRRNSDENKHRQTQSIGQQEKKNILVHCTCSEIGSHLVMPQSKTEIGSAKGSMVSISDPSSAAYCCKFCDKEKCLTHRKREVPELEDSFHLHSENSLHAVWGSSIKPEYISPLLKVEWHSEKDQYSILINSDVTTKSLNCKKSSKPNKKLKVQSILVAKENKKDEALHLVDKTAKKQPKDSLVFAIIDHSNAYGRIGDNHRKVLEKAFSEAVSMAILQSLETNPEIQIINCQFVQGIYKINVASMDCVAILRELVKELPELWPGAKLRFVADFSLPVLTKTALYFNPSAATRSSTEILSILGRQNRGLIVDLWEIYNRVQTENGFILEVGMDPNSVAYLNKPKGQVYFLTSKIRYKMTVKSISDEPLFARKNYN